MDSKMTGFPHTAIILAAGYGSRISSLTQDPKCLLKIQGKSLLGHHLEKWARAGIKKAHFVLGFEAQKIKDELEKYQHLLNIEFSYNNDYRSKGNTYSLHCALESVQGPTLIFDADLIYEDEVLQSFLGEQKGNQILVGDGDIDDIECAKTLADEEGFVRKTVDKRALTSEELSRLDFVGEALGILKFDKEGTQLLREKTTRFLKDPDNIQLNWEHLLNSCLDQIHTSYYKTASKKWIEIDTPEDFERANEIFEEGL